MKSIKLNIEPEILIWARKSIGKSMKDVARKMKIDKTIIKKWERGQRPIHLT